MQTFPLNAPFPVARSFRNVVGSPPGGVRNPCCLGRASCCEPSISAASIGRNWMGDSHVCPACFKFFKKVRQAFRCRHLSHLEGRSLRNVFSLCLGFPHWLHSEPATHQGIMAGDAPSEWIDRCEFIKHPGQFSRGSSRSTVVLILAGLLLGCHPQTKLVTTTHGLPGFSRFWSKVFHSRCERTWRRVYARARVRVIFPLVAIMVSDASVLFVLPCFAKMTEEGEHMWLPVHAQAVRLRELTGTEDNGCTDQRRALGRSPRSLCAKTHGGLARYIHTRHVHWMQVQSVETVLTALCSRSNNM